MAKHSFAAADRGDFLDGEDHARLIVRPHDRHDGSIRTDALIEQMKVQRTIRIDRQESDLAAPLLQKLAIIDVRWMFDSRHHHVFLLRLQRLRAVNRRIIALRAATGEDDFLGIRIDQGRHFGSGFLQVPGNFFPERVGAGSVAPMLAQERQHGVHHFRRDPRRGVVVKVIDLPLVHGATALKNNLLRCKSATDLGIRHQSI